MGIEKRFRLTKKQHEKIMNQDVGTGVVIMKINDNTYSTTEIFINGKGEPCYINDCIPSTPFDFDGMIKEIHETILNIESDEK